MLCTRELQSLGILAVRLHEESKETRLDKLSSIEASVVIPAGGDRRKRDLAKLEEKTSALMLSTYGTFRRAGFLWVVTKSE
jgi:hypothetical protein